MFHETISEREYRLGIKPTLERVIACLNYLGNPQEKFKSVLIGGTNGKGSVTYYLSNLCTKLTDYKIGRYTSPHLVSWKERFVINEKIVNDDFLNEISNEVLYKIKEFESKNPELGFLTGFEIYTVLAFYLFEKEKVDIAFLEVGMGGRLDATNVVSSKNTLCSVITNIAFDHTNYLGKTINEIAFEKAGIIKENNFVVSASSGEALSVIKIKANDLGSKLITVEKNDLLYPELNKQIALSAWREVVSKQIKINKSSFNEYDFLKSLQLRGRYQYLKEKNILLDGAHNPEAGAELKKVLEKHFTSKKIIYILGMLDKDYSNFIKNLIPQDSRVVCTEPKSSRATKKELLAKCVRNNNSISFISCDLSDAIKLAGGLEHDLIVITGSLYLVGEALQLLKEVCHA